MVIEDQGKGWVRFQGINFEIGNVLHIEIVGQDQTTITVKVPGHSHWTGNYMPRAYGAAYFQTYTVRRILQEPPNGVLILEVGKLGAEIPVRAKAMPYRPMSGYTSERGAS